MRTHACTYSCSLSMCGVTTECFKTYERTSICFRYARTAHRRHELQVCVVAQPVQAGKARHADIRKGDHLLYILGSAPGAVRPQRWHLYCAAAQPSVFTVRTLTFDLRTSVALGWHSGGTWVALGWHAGGSRVALGRHWGGTRVAHGWPSGMRRPQARATSSSSSELAWISPEGRAQ